VLFSAGYVAVSNIFSFGDTSIVNPGKISFVAEAPVITVTLTTNYLNDNLQTYFLQAFDMNNQLVDADLVVEDASSNGGAYFYTLTVSSCKGIAYILTSESPTGAIALRRIVYSTGSENN
jgi:hypothetical protein